MGNHYNIQYCFRESVKLEHLSEKHLFQPVFSINIFMMNIISVVDFLPHILFFILIQAMFSRILNLVLRKLSLEFIFSLFALFLFFLHSLSLLDLGTPQNGSCLGYLKLDHRHPISIPLRRTTNNLLD